MHGKMGLGSVCRLSCCCDGLQGNRVGGAECFGARDNATCLADVDMA